MMMERADIVKIAGAVFAILLQIVLAPNIALFGSFPNIPLVYVLTLAVVAPNSLGPVLPFVMGLICDLLGSGPVGAMAFLFMISAVLVSRIFSVINNDSLFMPLSCIFVGMLIMESLYGFLLVSLGLPVGVFTALIGKAAPCALYDFAVALLMYPVLLRLMSDSTPVSKNNMPQVKLR